MEPADSKPFTVFNLEPQASEFMFAIIEDGSRQYRIGNGDLLTVDYRAASNEGDSLTFDRVLLANAGGSSVIGQPVIDGASVTAEVVTGEFKGPKLEIQKFRRRKNSRRHTGHRQKHTVVRITGINVPGLASAPAEAAVE
jgi:large subunit ribosomal protein L21